MSSVILADYTCTETGCSCDLNDVSKTPVLNSLGVFGKRDWKNVVLCQFRAELPLYLEH